MNGISNKNINTINANIKNNKNINVDSLGY